MMFHRLFYRGMVIKFPTYFVRQPFPALFAKDLLKFIFRQFVHFLPHRESLEILTQFAARPFGTHNNRFLYFGLVFFFVVFYLSLIENAFLPETLHPFRAAAKKMHLQFFQTFLEERRFFL